MSRVAELELEAARLREQVEALGDRLRPLYWKARQLKNEVAKTHATWCHLDDTWVVVVTRFQPGDAEAAAVRRRLWVELDRLNREAIRPLKEQKDQADRVLKAVEKELAWEVKQVARGGAQMAKAKLLI